MLIPLVGGGCEAYKLWGLHKKWSVCQFGGVRWCLVSSSVVEEINP